MPARIRLLHSYKVFWIYFCELYCKRETAYWITFWINNRNFISLIYLFYSGKHRSLSVAYRCHQSYIQHTRFILVLLQWTILRQHITHKHASTTQVREHIKTSGDQVNINQQLVALPSSVDSDHENFSKP